MTSEAAWSLSPKGCRLWCCSMPRKPREIEQKIRNKFAFPEARVHSGDHLWHELRLEGLPIIFTKVSHSKAEIGAKLEGMIARQLRVNRRYLDGTIDCSHSSDDYRFQVRTSSTRPFDVGFLYRQMATTRNSIIAALLLRRIGALTRLVRSVVRWERSALDMMILIEMAALGLLRPRVEILGQVDSVGDSL